MKPRLALVACDWNGTLVDDAQRGLRATNAVLKTFSLPQLTMVGFRDSFRLPLHDYFAHLGIAALDIDDAVTRWNDEVAKSSSRLRIGTHALLDAAERCSADVGVMSAARHDVVAADARALGIVSRLSFIEGSVVSKQERLTAFVDQAEGIVLYIGDTEHDVHAALQAGAVAIAVSGGYRPAAALREAGAALICRDLTVLANHLTRHYNGIAT